MVRLMLTLTPVVCVLASIAFSVTLDNYVHTDAIPIDEGEEEEEEFQEGEEIQKINIEKKKVRFSMTVLMNRVRSSRRLYPLVNKFSNDMCICSLASLVDAPNQICRNVVLHIKRLQQKTLH